MKFTRITLEDGCKGWSYKTGEHTFRIEPRYNPHSSTGRGYVVFHTGPRPELKKLRKADNLPLDDDNTQLNKVPIETIKGIKSQIAELLEMIRKAG